MTDDALTASTHASPLSRAAPPHWMNETSGVLRAAINAYYHGRMTQAEVCAMRAYLRMWITQGDWAGPEVPTLRAMVDQLTTREKIAAWLLRAENWGIDPL